MRHTRVYAGACVLALLAPLLFAAQGASGGHGRAAFDGWPTHFEGRALTRLPLSEREERFGGDFPGHIARFTDGRRELIVRFVTEPTRKLHPASDCFAGLGYRVRPLPVRVDEAGARWGSFTAERGGETFRVHERIHADGGGSWADVSAWYWAAAMGDHAGPWWAVTVAERTAGSRQ
ncbi:MAG TPA: hypothetical protein VE360_00420 [Pyrinomonadaceae bacterium]|nr:hypothetical protein [Pyrinomonadaceae bacterium]